MDAIRAAINRAYVDLSPVSRDAIAGVLIDLDARLTAVEARVAAIEGAPIALAQTAPAVPGGLVIVGVDGIFVNPDFGSSLIEVGVT